MRAWHAVAASMVGMLGVLPGSHALPTTVIQVADGNGGLRRFSLSDYATELGRLQNMVAGCKQAPTNCDSNGVGPDAIVSLASGERTVRYEWLRQTLGSAAAGSKTSEERATTIAALGECSARLEGMATEIAAPPQADAANTTAEARRTLDAIFARGGFVEAKPPSIWLKPWRAFLRWLTRLLRSVMPSNPSRGTIQLLELSLISIPFCLLAWWFMRRLRNQRPVLSPVAAPHSSAPSAQDWQSWLDAGQRFALEGRWRDAIHHVYWSAIAFLESQRHWPADRTRTPREYLGLLGAVPEKRNELVLLTKSFEHTWYGGRTGGEPDYKEALLVLGRITAQ